MHLALVIRLLSLQSQQAVSRRSSGSFPGDAAAFAGGFTAIQPESFDAANQQLRPSAAKGKTRFAEVVQQEEEERGRRGRSPRTPETAATPAGAVDIVDWRMKSQSRSRSRSVSHMDVDWRAASRSRSVHLCVLTPLMTTKELWMAPTSSVDPLQHERFQLCRPCSLRRHRCLRCI